jgi:hypothetical protein
MPVLPGSSNPHMADQLEATCSCQEHAQQPHGQQRGGATALTPERDRNDQYACVDSHVISGRSTLVVQSQITDYRLPIGPIKVGRPRGANLGSMGNNRRHTVIMR